MIWVNIVKTMTMCCEESAECGHLPPELCCGHMSWTQ